jgi:hypothetical protein
MKKKKHKSRNPMIAILATPVFREKNHGRSTKIYNRKKIARDRLSGDNRLKAA